MAQNNYEDCSICGERKHVLNACPRCGFQRNPRVSNKRLAHDTQTKGAMESALEAALKKESISRSRGGNRFGKAATPRMTKSAPARSEETSRRASSPKVDSPRWSKLEDESEVRVRLAGDSHADAARGESPAAARTPPSRETTRTQVSTGTGAVERDIIIGLDLGTACTKVIIGDDVLRSAYAVPFGGLAYEGHPYLIATRVSAMPDGTLSLKAGEFSVTDLKIKLLGDPRQSVLADSKSGLEATALDVCVGYLALVLREVLAWFLDAHADTYRNARLAWQLNIGLPSRSYDNKRRQETFHEFALAAWRAAVQAGPITVESARDALKKSRDDIDNCRNGVDMAPGEDHLHPDDIAVVPEVIAEVVGYARSDLRREGTHLLIDVGASTLDVATFVLHSKDNEDQFSLLTTEVEQLGAFALHRQRVTDVAACVERRLNEILNVADGISPVPDLDAYQPIDEEGLQEIDTVFLARCDRLISMVVHETRTHRNPMAYVWDESLPVFLCGGGSRIQLYRDAVAAAERNATQIASFNFLDLPVPSGLEADELRPGEYIRLAVAYGLSTRRDRIGSVVPPQAIKDIQPLPARKTWHDNYIGPEQV